MAVEMELQTAFLAFTHLVSLPESRRVPINPILINNSAIQGSVPSVLI
jgi:hypothetical protein